MKKIKIFSWNVNGIRSAHKKGFIDWLSKTKPYILCLQEIKAFEKDLPAYLYYLRGYHTYWHSAKKPGYSGTAILTREKPLTVKYGLSENASNDEGRVVIAKFPDFSIINCYMPNGRRYHSRVPFKLKFYKKLFDKSLDLVNQGENLIVCGDFNVAHAEIDLAHPNANTCNTGFLPEERKCLDKFHQKNFFDMHRYFNPKKKGEYTWWSRLGDCRDKNIGWRFDYFFAHSSLLNKITCSKIHSDIELSDHCPISIDLQIEKVREKFVKTEEIGQAQQTFLPCCYF